MDNERGPSDKAASEALDSIRKSKRGDKIETVRHHLGVWYEIGRQEMLLEIAEKAIKEKTDGF